MPNISELVVQLGNGDQVQEYRARQALFQAVWHGARPGNEAETSQLASALCAELSSSQHSTRVRGEVCRFLSKVAGASEVQSLAAQLSDADVREMARWALERIPAAEATSALIACAQTAEAVEFRVGAIGSLAHKRGAEVVACLAACAADKEPEVAIAALEALAEQCDPASDAAFAQALAAGGSERTIVRIVRARLRLADSLVHAGHSDSAKAVFQAIAAGPAAPIQQAAAQRALAELG